MPNYKYKAITESGDVIYGEGYAPGREELRRDLEASGYHATKVKQIYLPSLGRRISQEDILFFIKEWIVLLRSGNTVPDSLAHLAKSRRNNLGVSLTKIREDILKGTSISQAFSRYAAVFDEILVGMLAAGEKGGEIIKTLQHYERHLGRKLNLTRKFRQALIYPALILFITIAILIIIFQFSLPRFVDIYADIGAELPLATQLLLRLGEHFHYLSAFVGITLIVAFAAFLYLKRHPEWSLSFERRLLNAPLIGKLHQAYLLSIFGYTLSSLIANGKPLVDALRQCAESMPNRYFTSRLKGVADELALGKSVSSAVTGAGFLPSTAERILMAGDRSGTLPEQLVTLADFYEDEMEHSLSIATALFEPLLILVTGVLVGGAVIIMYLPVFSLAGAIS